MNHALSSPAPHVLPDWRIADATHLGDDAYALTLLGAGDATAVVSWPRGVLSKRVEVTAWSSDDALDWLTDNAEQVWDACWLGRVSP